MQRQFNPDNGYPCYSWGTTLDLQRSALRWDIKRTMKGLCSKLEEIGEECIVLTANVNNGWVGHIGTNRGDEYINAKSHILYDFLNYCGESVDVDSDTEQTKDTEQSDDEISMEPRRGLEIRLKDDTRPAYDPDNILQDLARAADDSVDDKDDSGAEDVTPLVARQPLQIPASMWTNAVQGDVKRLNNLTAPGTRMNKSTAHPVASSGLVTSTHDTPETNTESQLLITDIRTQFLENTDRTETGANKTDEIDDKSHSETAVKGLKRKRTNSKIRPHSEIAISESVSQLPSIPFSRLATCPTNSELNLSDDVNLSKDRPNRVLRSSNRKKAKKPSLAHLLRRQKCRDSESENTGSADSEDEEMDSNEDIEQDDPTDEDWHLDTQTHRTSARKK